MSYRKRLLLLLLAVAVVALVALSFRPEPVAVEVAVVDHGPLRESVSAEGVARVRERYAVSAPVSAFAPRIDLEVGDPVAAGQPLLTLRPVPAQLLDPRSRAEAQANHRAAQALLEAERHRLDAARAAAEFAQREYQRLEGLYRRKDISRSDLERARSEAGQAQAALAAAGAAVEQAGQRARAALAVLDWAAADPGAAPAEGLTLEAPVAGRVLAVPRPSAGVVAPGQTLLELGDPRDLEVAVDVLSADAVRIHPGDRVLVSHWGGAGDIEARVRRIEPTGFTKVSALGVEEQRVWVIADLTAAPAQWQGLGDGYRVEAEFVLWEGSEVLQVPASALFRAGQEWAAFVVEQGQAQRRRVEPGHRGAFATEVLAGLARGERVVTHPDDALADGVPVVERR